MKNKRESVLLSFVLILLIPTVTSLGLSGQKLSPIIYEPGKIIVNHYTITGTNLPTVVSYDGEMSDYVSISEVINDEFDLTIAFPEEPIPPGNKYFSLSVTEIPENQAGVGSSLGVTKRFEVVVYSFDKEVSVSLEAPNVNVGKEVPFQLTVSSQGYIDIDSVK